MLMNKSNILCEMDLINKYQVFPQITLDRIAEADVQIKSPNSSFEYGFSESNKKHTNDEKVHSCIGKLKEPNNRTIKMLRRMLTTIGEYIPSVSFDSEYTDIVMKLLNGSIEEFDFGEEEDTYNNLYMTRFCVEGLDFNFEQIDWSSIEFLNFFHTIKTRHADDEGQGKEIMDEYYDANVIGGMLINEEEEYVHVVVGMAVRSLDNFILNNFNERRALKFMNIKMDPFEVNFDHVQQVLENECITVRNHLERGKYLKRFDVVSKEVKQRFQRLENVDKKGLETSLKLDDSDHFSLWTKKCSENDSQILTRSFTTFVLSNELLYLEECEFIYYNPLILTTNEEECYLYFVIQWKDKQAKIYDYDTFSGVRPSVIFHDKNFICNTLNQLGEDTRTAFKNKKMILNEIKREKGLDDTSIMSSSKQMNTSSFDIDRAFSDLQKTAYIRIVDDFEKSFDSSISKVTEKFNELKSKKEVTNTKLITLIPTEIEYDMITIINEENMPAVTAEIFKEHHINLLIEHDIEEMGELENEIVKRNKENHEKMLELYRETDSNINDEVLIEKGPLLKLLEVLIKDISIVTRISIALKNTTQLIESFYDVLLSKIYTKNSMGSQYNLQLCLTMSDEYAHYIKQLYKNEQECALVSNQLKSTFPYLFFIQYFQKDEFSVSVNEIMQNLLDNWRNFGSLDQKSIIYELFSPEKIVLLPIEVILIIHSLYHLMIQEEVIHHMVHLFLFYTHTFFLPNLEKNGGLLVNEATDKIKEVIITLKAVTFHTEKYQSLPEDLRDIIYLFISSILKIPIQKDRKSTEIEYKVPLKIGGLEVDLKITHSSYRDEIGNSTFLLTNKDILAILKIMKSIYITESGENDELLDLAVQVFNGYLILVTGIDKELWQITLSNKYVIVNVKTGRKHAMDDNVGFSEEEQKDISGSPILMASIRNFMTLGKQKVKRYMYEERFDKESISNANKLLQRLDQLLESTDLSTQKITEYKDTLHQVLSYKPHIIQYIRTYLSYEHTLQTIDTIANEITGL